MPNTRPPRKSAGKNARSSARAAQQQQQQQRHELATTEAQVGDELQRDFTRLVAQPLSPHIAVFSDAYSRKLQEVRAASGNPRAQVPLTWLHDRSTAGGDISRLQRTVQVHVGQFAHSARATIAGGMNEAQDLGTAHAEQQLVAALQPAAPLLATQGMTPQDLVVRSDARVAGVSRVVQRGTSLNALYDSFAPDTGDRLYQNLLAGISSGDNPRTVADLLYGIVGNNLQRAQVIARTEMLRTYKSAQLANFAANSDVVGQWQWSCDLTGRTCAACLAMDGTLHTLDEELDDHCLGRCAAVPVTKSWSDILAPFGIDGSDLDAQDAAIASARPSGAEWFAEQDAATQRDILRPAKFNAYQAGALQLSDLAAVDHDPVWGSSIREKSLSELGIGDAQAWLGRGPNVGVPVRVPIEGGGYTYVTPGPVVREEEPQYNMAGRSQGWGGIDEAMRGLR